MGNKVSIRKIGFEDVKYLLNKGTRFIIINTLDEREQNCLIKGTISPSSIYKKYEKLLSLGFNNIFVYAGGIFEWLCLQDIYGENEFPTTSKELDILKYKPLPVLNKPLLINTN